MKKPHTHTTKPFSEGNHAANDKPGKKVVIAFLKSVGINAIENPDDYGVDLLAAGYEVERRTIKSTKWPYPTVHVPYRKDKFFENIIFYAVNVHHEINDDIYDTVMLCSSEIVIKYPVVEVPNKSVPKDEYFFDVPFKEWFIPEWYSIPVKDIWK